MKRYLLAAATAALVLSHVNADDTGRAYIRAADTVPAAHSTPVVEAGYAGPAYDGPVAGGCASGNCGAVDTSHGLHPLLRKLIWWKKPGCSTGKKCGGLFGPRCNSGTPEAFNPYPNGVPGTLVFPQHPFVRSPRDFWMW